MSFGRNRQSIADIEQELQDIFNNHPQSHANDSGEPVIPADALVDVFRAFSEVYNGVELMSGEEMDMLKGLLAANPGLEVTPQILLQFIAEKTKHSPHESPPLSSGEDVTEVIPRGRDRDREVDDNHRPSRSPSSESVGSSAFARATSRPFPQSLGTPPSAKSSSSFDSSRRQRTTPLGNNAPSSWSKPRPAHRRRSDAGSRSDSESTGPTSFSRVHPRSRAPSNPTSPSKTSLQLQSAYSPITSPSFTSGSRSHSRAQSQPKTLFNSGYPYGGGDDPDSPTSPLDDYTRTMDNFMDGVSSRLMPRQDDDSDSEDISLGLVPDRTSVSSTVSMEPQERLEALQRVNAELSRKLIEAEQTLLSKLNEHESELEEMQSRLEEVRSELSATNREEKELRSKERQNISQIAALESEIGKLQKNLDNARVTYTSLQKHYQEQCTESERYRNTLRRRDQEIKDLQDAAAIQVIENQKSAKERETYEDRIQHLESDLVVAQQAHLQLDEQKQENMMLKETIDRMRFDMDELRNAMTSAVMAGSGNSSAANSISKSLGAELMGKMKVQWGVEGVDSQDDLVMVAPEMDDTVKLGSSGSFVDEEDESADGDDFIQTIITRKTRKVPGRTNRIVERSFEEVKEYSDAYTQHDTIGFTSSKTIQTDPIPTEPTPTPKVTVGIEIQTDEPESQSSTPRGDETVASSSTLLPPTPRSQTDLLLHPHSHDLPPSYNQITEQDQDWLLAADTLKKWHEGVNIPLEGVPTGISEDAIGEWKALKEELGVGCVVIDKTIASSKRTGLPRTAISRQGTDSTGDATEGAVDRKGRFYNIYNTYVYGAGRDGVTQFWLGIGATALVFLAMSPYMVPHYSVPGGPTYYDRAVWHSFNSMQATGEGFSADGTTAVWSLLGRVGGGAARIARGWPT